MFEKTYDAASIEPRIREVWQEADAFRAGAGAGRDAQTFCIVIPPPNVTGSLHMGHALNNTLQDVMVRFERMRGKDVLWQPGTDHAGIATQMVVERQLAANGEPTRREMGREAFLDRVWAWKAESGGAIKGQLDRLGASCDWSRDRFTMDAGLSEAVLTVFVRLHKQGLIYRDKRLVNWDPKFLTAISDLEVESKEVKGTLTHFRYPLEGVTFDPEDPSTYIVVATTRPETMLGDTAVAVHPEDERYAHLIGKNVVLPLVGRRIPIVGDTYSDPEKGSGAVKITPAHDFNDFEVGKRHKLPVINIFDEQAAVLLEGNADFAAGLDPATVAALVDELHGEDRFAARKAIVAKMEEGGFVEKIEDNVHMVPYGDRSGVAIEPFLTDQWYVNAKRLAGPAMDAVNEGKTKFVPANWSKTYFDWMENIQPWCVSRQLWWGHQIPAWYGPDGKIYVERSEADVARTATIHYGTPIRFAPRAEALAAWEAGTEGETLLYRDEDVLDTWFSSALWPFSTLGWPERTPELRKYYPTSVLSTGFDIIFFWVARMMMMGMHFLNQVPFDTVYIHALVRDEKGAKMSKSKGNVVDPLELMDEFGADALRFTLAAMAAQGRDVKIAKARVQGYRNFATKLWNATRFADMNECRIDPAFDPADAQGTLSRWVLTEANRTAGDVTRAIEAYRFNDAAAAIYRFTWNTFCDWFLELAKPGLIGQNEDEKKELRAVTAHVIDQILVMLHPFMPFITEELWAITAEQSGIERETLLIHTPWPTGGFEDGTAADEINFVVDLVAAVRSLRSESNVPAATEAEVVVVGGSRAQEGWLASHDAAIRRLARASELKVSDIAPPNSAQSVVGDVVVCLPLAGLVDLAAERARLAKELKRLESDVAKIDGRLSNPKFLEKADADTIDEQREKRGDAEAKLEKLRAAIGRLEPVD
ncbi:valine--tRNA ligase [Acuticoccus sp. I52.16.1]|uniref:valine--tRNA ligase n=1 Tax=Acuticoccus sp. I52.16.1 TaxID=2928472 RepID=UPI001FD5F57B|nr:valine--tRNA ligase [Acuticoccus sp. I52.16.1]UOM33069.1 valine--tRNA ligase [Acuticoccus sp. I52.16.1]